jgi:anti-sigma-K factor RskA
MRENNHIVEMLPEYVLGCLDDREARQVASHLAGCAMCRSELGRLEEVAADLALLVPAETPPAALKERLMERVGASGGRVMARRVVAERRPIGQRWLPAWGVVSLLLIAILGAVSLTLWQRLERLERAAEAGDMEAIPLAGTEAAPAATGYIIISGDGLRGALVVDGLEPLAEEKEYQLWLIRNGERTSGAVFSVAEDGYGGTRIWVEESLFAFSAANITVEPAGGSSEPSGEAVLQGQLIEQ